MEEKWLGDAGVVDVEDIEFGKLNIIEAPCGCGKTTYIEKTLFKETMCGDTLYLIDSKNGLDAFNHRGEIKEYNGQIYYKHDHITAMTYACFAVICMNKAAKFLWDDPFSFIVCDELHSAIKWAKIYKWENSGSFGTNLHQVALDELHKRIQLGLRLVAISATPDNIRQEFENEYVDVPLHGTLRQYHSNETRVFVNIHTLLNELPLDKRGVIYTPHISQILDIRNKLNEKGIHAVGFWSKNNTDYDMDEEALAARRSVVERGIIPENIQVLLINAASETGLNITSPVDYMVVNDSNPDTQIQAVGRIRHDLDTVYLRDYKSDEVANFSHGSFPSKWLNCRLYAKDKELLCEELNIRDSRGRLLKWPSIKRGLKYSGYSVYDKQEKGGNRYSIITE